MTGVKLKTTPSRSERIADVEAQERWEVATKEGETSMPDIGSLVVPIIGAYPLSFSQNRSSRCGGAVGMSVDVATPNRYGYSGGVIDRTDIVALRDFLTAWLNGTLDYIEEPEATP